jgi:hypothetical protein
MMYDADYCDNRRYHPTQNTEGQNPMSYYPLDDHNHPIYNKPHRYKNQETNNPMEETSEEATTDTAAVIHVSDNTE